MPIRGFKFKINIGGDEIPANPETLFRRIVLAKKDDSELMELFEFEVAAYLLSVFEGSLLNPFFFYDLFFPITDSMNLQGPYITKGGFVLHRVHWANGDTFTAIIRKHVEYITIKTTVDSDG